jgi:hypothetical protein
MWHGDYKGLAGAVVFVNHHVAQIPFISLNENKLTPKVL